jgi:uncharacterized protein with FMN-binding domain
VSKTATALAVAGSSLATLALAGCAPSAGASDSAAPSSDAGGVDPSTTFHDGTYTATGHYISPGGPSAVAVKLTLKDNRVTALTVTPKAENPTAVSYETRFASGVNGLVVGKRITELRVTKVSGSSLTSMGFDKAVAAIEEQAAR